MSLAWIRIVTNIVLIGWGILLVACDKKHPKAERCFEYWTLDRVSREFPRDASESRWMKRRVDAQNRLLHDELLSQEGRNDGSDTATKSRCFALMERTRSRPLPFSRSLARSYHHCVDALEANGDFPEALIFLNYMDSIFENDPNFGSDSAEEEVGTLARKIARAQLLRGLGNCKEYLDRELTSALFGDGDVAQCLRQIHSPDSILLEFERSLEKVVVGTYPQAPVQVQKAVRSHYPGLKEVTFAWTTVFGIPHILPAPPKDELRHTREEFIERYKEDGLYGQMYCLPNARDSLELERDRKTR